MDLAWADRTLMPNFPGIENAESTQDWDAGFPLIYKIRPKDEEYWKQYRGTPKAFVTLAAGQKMWANRFGNLTAIRFPIPEGADAEGFQKVVEHKLLATINPDDLGRPGLPSCLKGGQSFIFLAQAQVHFSQIIR